MELRVSSAAPEKRIPYFFVSYAHDNAGDDDLLVRQFFHHLRADVRLYSTAHPDQVGFLDSDNLRAGHRWSPELVRALANCQVFLALCSPAYFSRPSCGKEWTVFDQRIRDHERHTGRLAPPALIPLFWVPVPVPALPAAVSAYQHRDDVFGPAYQRHGLRDLVRLDRHRDDYKIFVSALARRIVDLARHGLRPATGMPEFDAIPPAFPSPGDDRGPRRGSPGRAPEPPGHLPEQRVPLRPDSGQERKTRQEQKTGQEQKNRQEQKNGRQPATRTDNGDPRPILNPNLATKKITKDGQP
jgi:hypothetical protein